MIFKALEARIFEEANAGHEHGPRPGSTARLRDETGPTPLIPGARGNSGVHDPLAENHLFHGEVEADEVGFRKVRRL